MGTKLYKRKPDCAHYNDCMSRAAFNDDTLKCSGCRQYRFQAYEFDLFKNKEDFIIYLPSVDDLFAEFGHVAGMMI